MKRLAALLLVLGLTSGCHDSRSSSGVTVSNLGLEAFQIHQGDDLIAFRANEGQPRVRDGREGNGDGDEQDSILFVRDLRTGQTESLRSAVSELAVSGRVVAFALWEQRQGMVDLNNDGDDDDFILFVYDVDRDILRSTGQPVEQGFQIDGDVVAFVTSESQDGGTDLNGDGDAVDFVAQLHRVSSGVTTNLAIPVTTHPVVRDEIVAVVRREDDTDLNGDGDTNDNVLQVVEALNGNITNLGVAVDSDPLPFTPFLAIDSGQVLFAGYEFSQDEDLNGDGDLDDRIVHVWDFPSVSLFNTGLPNLGAWTTLSNGGFMNLVAEFPADLNGDGDMLDLVMHAYDIPTRTLTNLGVAAFDTGRMDDGRFVFMADEMAQGQTDLNGDGDAFDQVVFTYANGVLDNVGATVAAQLGQVLTASPERLILAVDEAGQGQTDFNGDGDAFDLGLHRWTPAGGLVDLGLEGQLLSVDGDRVVYFVEEKGLDLNGDGDAMYDRVLHTVDFTSGHVRNLRVALQPMGPFDAPRELRNGYYPLLVDEFSQNRDLNGDGSIFASVLHVFRAP